MAATFRTSRSTAAHWLALLAGLMLTVSPANLLAQCGCGVCPCGAGSAAEASDCCCQALSDSCCAGPADNTQAGCHLAGNCPCEFNRSPQPADSRDGKLTSSRGEFASTPAVPFTTSIPPVHSPNAAAFDSSLLPAQPPVRILFCVWRN
jgi:hypothetical protein